MKSSIKTMQELKHEWGPYSLLARVGHLNHHYQRVWQQ